MLPLKLYQYWCGKTEIVSNLWGWNIAALLVFLMLPSKQYQYWCGKMEIVSNLWGWSISRFTSLPDVALKTVPVLVW